MSTEAVVGEMEAVPWILYKWDCVEHRHEPEDNSFTMRFKDLPSAAIGCGDTREEAFAELLSANISLTEALFAWLERAENGLRNCLALAGRRRNGPDAEWWAHVVRFCDEAGIKPRITRESSTPSVKTPEGDEMNKEAIPRRTQMEKWCRAEHAISDAVRAVEDMPADERLTRAVILLGEAKDRVADYVDTEGPPEPDLLPCPFCGEEPYLHRPSFGGDHWQIGCDCEGGEDDDEGAIWRNGKTFEDAALRWNRRP